jgi:hypothetical protein
MSKHQFGWIPDRPDQRDLMFSAVYKPIPKLPASVDLQATFSAVEDQGSLGSCTANALVGALEFLENKDHVPFTDLSRLFVYYNERVIEHTVGSDSGAMLRDGIKTLAKQGVCSEKKWPYAIPMLSSISSALISACELWMICVPVLRQAIHLYSGLPFTNPSSRVRSPKPVLCPCQLKESLYWAVTQL